MSRFCFTPFTLCALALCFAGPFSPAHAAITATGDVSPTITTWGTSTTGYVGNTARAR